MGQKPGGVTVKVPALLGFLKPIITRVKKDTKIIGLVGGIASGESTVLRELQKRKKIETIDLDKIGHDVLKIDHVKKTLVSRFGEEILTEGEVDRVKLRNIMFTDEVSRRKLQNIVIPQIIWQAYKRILAIKKADPGVEAIVLEGVSIVDVGMQKIMDQVWYVDAPEDKRLEWALADTTRTAVDRENIQKMIEAQRPMLEKARAEATVIINNSNDFNDLARQIEQAIAISIKGQNKSGQDAAMNGGIDLGLVNVDMPAGSPIQFHLDPAQLAQWQAAPGVTFDIISMQPITNTAQWLGI